MVRCKCEASPLSLLFIFRPFELRLVAIKRETWLPGFLHENRAIFRAHYNTQFIIFPFSLQHHLPDDDPTQLTAEAIKIFLDDILEGSAPVYGGSSYTVR